MAEIKISELSIGDWVVLENQPFKVIGINPPYVDLLGNGNRLRLSDIDNDNLSSIPLTPEILDKNGLCVVEEDADFSEYELFGSENFSIFHAKGTLHYRLETPQASVVCWSVHQLQHALRLAGVEKEIEV